MALPISRVTTQQTSRHFVKTCDQCGSTDQKMITCAQCHIAKYCSEVCQSIAWLKHRVVCQVDTKQQALVADDISEATAASRKKNGALRECSIHIGSFHDLKAFSFSIHKIHNSSLSEMLLAAKSGDLTAMEQLLDLTDDLDQPAVQDALCFAAIFGQAEIVELMIQKGVNPATPRKYNPLIDDWTERLTAMGHAIENRQNSVIAMLHKYGVGIDETFRKTRYVIEQGALDIFFSKHPLKGSNPLLLRQILQAGAKIAPLIHKTIFTIAVHSSTEELSLLIDMGFDPKTICIEESHPEFKGRNCNQYKREVSLLDLAVMEAERANIFEKNQDSIDRVALLLANGADSTSRKNYCNQNYLHQVSLPQLVDLFCQAGVSSTEFALYHESFAIHVRPIDIAHSEDIIKVLCAAEEDALNSSFSKGTLNHQQALVRIGFDPAKGLDQLDADGELFLTKAARAQDISAFVALIGEGVDVNQIKPTKGMWTVMHRLFADVYDGSVSEEYDYLNIANDYRLKLINILIKHGAVPLKDAVGRTPLMCMTLHPFNAGFNNKVIDLYSDYEAKYYNVDCGEYRDKFCKLRDGGFVTVRAFPASVAIPIRTDFERFWKSFEDHSEFNPSLNDNSTAEWNQMRTGAIA